MRSLFLLPVLLLTAAQTPTATPAAAQPAAQPATQGSAAEQAIRRHIEVLASDEFEGRRPGTQSEFKTLEYIATQLANAGFEPAGVDGKWFQPVRVRETEKGPRSNYVSHNLLARLPGTGGTGESVLFLGHWDHLGICMPKGSDDEICNGAVDNASGIAVLIEVAKAFAAGPRPQRDILVLATTAEELGLVGARHFVAKPTVPLKSIVAAINIDTVAVHHAGEPVAIIGHGVQPLDRLIEETALELGRTMDQDRDADAFLRRQDGYVFKEAGVPSVMIGGSFANSRSLRAFISGPYHKPNDDLNQELILDGAAEDMTLMIALGRKLADPARYSRP